MSYRTSGWATSSPQQERRHMQIYFRQTKATLHIYSKNPALHRHRQRLKFAFLFNCGNCGFALLQKKLKHTHTCVKHITKIPFLRKRCLYNFFHNATKHCNIFLWPHIFLPSHTQCRVSSKHSRNSKADMSFDTVEVVASFHGFLLWLSAFHQEEKINKIKYTRIALPQIESSGVAPRFASQTN